MASSSPVQSPDEICYKKVFESEEGETIDVTVEPVVQRSFIVRLRDLLMFCHNNFNGWNVIQGNTKAKIIISSNMSMDARSHAYIDIIGTPFGVSWAEKSITEAVSKGLSGAWIKLCGHPESAATPGHSKGFVIYGSNDQILHAQHLLTAEIQTDFDSVIEQLVMADEPHWADLFGQEPVVLRMSMRTNVELQDWSPYKTVHKMSHGLMLALGGAILSLADKKEFFTEYPWNSCLAIVLILICYICYILSFVFNKGVWFAGLVSTVVIIESALLGMGVTYRSLVEYKCALVGFVFGLITFLFFFWLDLSHHQLIQCVFRQK